MNLIQVRDSDKYTFNNEDVKTVFEISGEILKGNLQIVKKRYKDKRIQPELVSVIGIITNSSLLIQKGATEKGGINMCTALEQLEKKGFKEGTKLGIEKGTKLGIEKGTKLGILQRDRELILKWSAAGYSSSEIAALLDLPEEKVRKIQSNPSF